MNEQTILDCSDAEILNLNIRKQNQNEDLVLAFDLKMSGTLERYAIDRLCPYLNPDEKKKKTPLSDVLYGGGNFPLYPFLDCMIFSTNIKDAVVQLKSKDTDETVGFIADLNKIVVSPQANTLQEVSWRLQCTAPDEKTLSAIEEMFLHAKVICSVEDRQADMFNENNAVDEKGVDDAA